jgi:hypothetical protein
MSQVAHWLPRFFKFGVPLLLVIFVGSAIYDSLDRWPIAESALRSYPGESAILTGLTYSFAGSEWKRSASYILFPSLREITIKATSRSGPNVTESSFGLFGMFCVLAWTAGTSALSVWYWVRSTGRRAT